MSTVQIGGVDHAFLPLRATSVDPTTSAELLPLIHTTGASFFPYRGISGTLFLQSSGAERGQLAPLALKSNIQPLSPKTLIDIDSAVIRGSFLSHVSFVNIGASGSGGNQPTPPPSTGVVYPVYR